MQIIYSMQYPTFKASNHHMVCNTQPYTLIHPCILFSEPLSPRQPLAVSEPRKVCNVNIWLDWPVFFWPPKWLLNAGRCITWYLVMCCCCCCCLSYCMYDLYMHINKKLLSLCSQVHDQHRSTSISCHRETGHAKNSRANSGCLCKKMYFSNFYEYAGGSHTTHISVNTISCVIWKFFFSHDWEDGKRKHGKVNKQNWLDPALCLGCRGTCVRSFQGCPIPPQRRV